TLSLGMVMGLAVGASAVQADDIEIYLQEPPDPVPPNVLFILDESGSMDSGSPSRMSRLKSAMATILGDDDMDNVIAGILGYTTKGSQHADKRLRVISDFLEVEDNSDAMIDSVNGLSPYSYTPTVRALDAGVKWFQGTFKDDGAVTPKVSPIAGTAADNWCKPNHMVILTDGIPNANRLTDKIPIRKYPELTGPSCTSVTISGYTDGGTCAAEIAQWAYETDLKTETGWDEQQNIVTHSIGFDTTDGALRAFMKSIADAGGGDYYDATSAADLVSAFKAIIVDAAEGIPYTYSSPAIPFNPDNAALSGDYLYVPMFEPMPNKFWKGNLKKYKLTTVTTTDIDGKEVVDIVIKDKDDNDVLDSSYGFVSS
ncbi:MAG: VWA domain-containing protein, partial [Gammaproteobacteria bacterium]|nr:VWA domain-containing protein [Gammaproteobacteria bacterium]